MAEEKEKPKLMSEVMVSNWQASAAQGYLTVEEFRWYVAMGYVTKQEFFKVWPDEQLDGPFVLLDWGVPVRLNLGTIL